MDSHPKCTSYNCNHLGACILGTKDNLVGYTTRYYRKERKVRRTGKGAKVKRAWMGVVPGWVTLLGSSHQVIRNKVMS
ncbi:hypothetical protein OSB04_024217 [Centaurea solstitialis]|uniref:Uncharacterized protein n=1 Tax=Centaurea solstitialis TaxID=347529 RepID=A0AA38SY11_9ASTR|nr:hypothetical protein OSB04_024217 [Centaurea solstitialis]